MSFDFEAIIGYVNDIHHPVNLITHNIDYTLLETLSILDLFDIVCININNYLTQDFPNANYIILYRYDKGIITFCSKCDALLHFSFCFLLLKYMSKVRIEHEDVFIGKTYHLNGDTIIQDPIPDKYHSFYNPTWVANTSPKKK
jgi:hypothetical protein